MNILQNKLNSCNSCPFEDYEINWYDEKTGTGKLGAHIYEESDNSVMVVGQNPSHRRWPGEHSMKGRQGDVFREIFGKEHLVFTNFIQVSTPDNKVTQLTDEQVNHCIEHLLFEIAHLKPVVIIVCSSYARSKLSILNRLNDLSKWGANVVFVKHPDYYLTYKRGSLEEYYSELKSIKQSCT